MRAKITGVGGHLHSTLNDNARFELIQRIATGGMAEVFQARLFGAHGFEKLVAIKRILPSYSADPTFERRFIAEAKLAAALDHPNIVRILDLTRFGKSLYITMELIDGPDLAEVSRRARDTGDQIPLGMAVFIAQEIMRGLEFAHSRNVVHRDISTSNVLVSRAGEVKIADFGIAVSGDHADRTFTETGKVVGKWRFMSPEQSVGDRLDHRSDLFSAGVVLFELFTGTVLFSGDNPRAIVHQIHDGDIPALRSLCPTAPTDLEAVLHHLLERDPDRRPNRAGEVLRRLTSLAGSLGEPVSAIALSDWIGQRFKSKLPAQDSYNRTSKLINAIMADELRQVTRSRLTAGAAGPTFAATAETVSERGSGTGVQAHSGHALVRVDGPEPGLSTWHVEPTPPAATSDQIVTVSSRPPNRSPSAAERRDPERSKRPGIGRGSLIAAILAGLAIAGSAVLAVTLRGSSGDGGGTTEEAISAAGDVERPEPPESAAGMLADGGGRTISAPSSTTDFASDAVRRARTTDPAATLTGLSISSMRADGTLDVTSDRAEVVAMLTASDPGQAILIRYRGDGEPSVDRIAEASTGPALSRDRIADASALAQALIDAGCLSLRPGDRFDLNVSASDDGNALYQMRPALLTDDDQHWKWRVEAERSGRLSISECQPPRDGRPQVTTKHPSEPARPRVAASPRSDDKVAAAASEQGITILTAGRKLRDAMFVNINNMCLQHLPFRETPRGMQLIEFTTDQHADLTHASVAGASKRFNKCITDAIGHFELTTMRNARLGIYYLFPQELTSAVASSQIGATLNSLESALAAADKERAAGRTPDPASLARKAECSTAQMRALLADPSQLKAIAIDVAASWSGVSRAEFDRAMGK